MDVDEMADAIYWKEDPIVVVDGNQWKVEKWSIDYDYTPSSMVVELCRVVDGQIEYDSISIEDVDGVK